MFNYNVQNHYWVVSESTTQVYSSAAAAYVPVTDATYEAWLACGSYPTRIDTEANLKAVFAQQYPAGWASVALQQAAQAALDKSDRTVIRCYRASVAVPTAWQTYYDALVAIRNGTDTISTELPSRPAYPVGT